MTTAKVAISIEDDVLRKARKEVARGRAKSLSALVTILDAVDAELGKPKKSAVAWARRALGR